MIEWRRLAEPQVDQYDTAVTLRFATADVSPRRGRKFQRRQIGSDPSIFDGHVSVRHLFATPKPPVGPTYVNGPLVDPNIDEAVNLVRAWPTAFAQFCGLMDTFNPVCPADPSAPQTSSSSHSEEEFFGSMYATVHDPVFLAECFVHEMAHNKLRALGVGITVAATLVRNAPSELYVSPIIKHRKRPMTAVLHATYSFAYVAALDLRVVARSTERMKARFTANLARNLKRLEEGVGETRRNLRVTDEGHEFMEGLYAWIDRIQREGADVLGRDNLFATKAVTA